jgi:hypothetical protein
MPKPLEAVQKTLMRHNPSLKIGSKCSFFLDEDLNQDRYEIDFDQRLTW